MKKDLLFSVTALILFNLLFFSSVNKVEANFGCAEYSGAIEPKPGRLTIIHIPLKDDEGSKKGQSTLIVGPTGITVLMDVGAGSDDATKIKNKVSDINSQINSNFKNLSGWNDKATDEVDYVVLTHFHSDHAGNFDDLFGGQSPLMTLSSTVPGKSYGGKVIYRGFYNYRNDGGDAGYIQTWSDACNLLTNAFSSKKFVLCYDGSTPLTAESCNTSSVSDVSTCPNLNKGDIQDTGDDSSNLTSFIDLGTYQQDVPDFQAKMYFYAANRIIRTSNGEVPVNKDTTKENSQSIAGIITYGNFRYSFGGDLTSGPEEDINSNSGQIKVGDSTSAPLIPCCPAGVDVYLVHHHGNDTSSDPLFVDLLLPDNSASKNAIIPVKTKYGNAPDTNVIWRLLGYSFTDDGTMCNQLPNSPDRKTGPRVDSNGRVWLLRDGWQTKDSDYKNCTTTDGKPFHSYYTYIKRGEKDNGTAGLTIVQTEPPTSYSGTYDIKKYMTKFYVDSSKNYCLETNTIDQQ